MTQTSSWCNAVMTLSNKQAVYGNEGRGPCPLVALMGTRFAMLVLFPVLPPCYPSLLSNCTSKHLSCSGQDRPFYQVASSSLKLIVKCENQDELYYSGDKMHCTVLSADLWQFM